MRLELIRARGDRTQIEVAQKMGVSQRYISKLERGKGNPSLKTAIKLADYYKSSIELLFPDVFSTNATQIGSIKKA